MDPHRTYLRSRVPELAALIALIALMVLSLSALGSPTTQGFIENKGQVHDQFYKPRPDVRYLFAGEGMNVQLRMDGFSYDTYRVEGDGPMLSTNGDEELETIKLLFHFHRIDLQFINADPDHEVIAEGENEDYTNYYSGVTGPAGATMVRTFSRITYRNVWPDIDVRFNSTAEGFKYDVVVRPGGDLMNVRFRVEGATITVDPDGRLVFDWTGGSLNERIPASFFETGRKHAPAHVIYSADAANNFGFKLLGESTPATSTLIIDPSPSLTWATYYGGSFLDFGEDAGLDLAGNAYLAGTTISTQNIASGGAYDATWNGATDAFIAKFNQAGARLWGTYYGGDMDENLRGSFVSQAGVSAICGFTTSREGIATPGTHQTEHADGLMDGFIAVFTSSGQLTWGTYYGGTNDDDLLNVTIHSSGKVGVCGKTKSIQGIATLGAPDIFYGGGDGDACVGWFSATGTRLWGTYLGGSGADSAPGICTVGTTSIAVAGTTTSVSGIATSGTHDASHNGGSDAFLVKYDVAGAGSKVWGTYYGGTAGDGVGGVASISSTTIAICGSTSSTNGIATPDAEQDLIGGGSDAFIGFFNQLTGARIKGTYAGGTSNDVFSSIESASSAAFVVCGWQFSAGQGTPNSWNPTGPGPYAAGYSTSGDKLWGGYLTCADRCAANSVTMVVACTHGANGAATPNAFQPNYAGGFEDAFFIRLNTTPAGMMLEGTDLAPTHRAMISTNASELTIVPQAMDVSSTTSPITIMDASGRVMKTDQLGPDATFHTSIAGWASGIYTAVIEGEGHRSVVHFVIP